MEAIILSRRDVREYDQMITLYTRERGRVELLARGVKKIVSKNASHLEPGVFALVESVSGKEMEHLTTAQAVEIFSGLRTDGEKLSAVQYAMFFVTRMTKDAVPDERLFFLLLDWLRFVERTPVWRGRLLDALIANCLCVFGFAPRVADCVICNQSRHAMVDKEFIDREKFGMYFAGGGLICSPCREVKVRVGEDIYTCSLKEISNLDMLLTANWKAVLSYFLPPDEDDALHALLYAFVVYHSEQYLVDWRKPWYDAFGMIRTVNNMNNNNESL